MNLLIIECVAIIGMIFLIIVEDAYERHEEQKWREPIKHIGVCPICHRKAYLLRERKGEAWTVICSRCCPGSRYYADETPDAAVIHWRLWAGEQWLKNRKERRK
jgi:hypothetical protein